MKFSNVMTGGNGNKLAVLMKPEVIQNTKKEEDEKNVRCKRR